MRWTLALTLGAIIAANVVLAASTTARGAVGRIAAARPAYVGKAQPLGLRWLGVRVYAGYYDTHHAGDLEPKPDPWQGSSDVLFLGKPGPRGWDAGAVRIYDGGRFRLASVTVTVDIGKHHFALWKTVSLSPGETLIVTQTADENFDTSDTNAAGCFTCSRDLCTTEISHTIPIIHVTIDGATRNYRDTGQILNTGGVDRAGCPETGDRNDESEPWQWLPLTSVTTSRASVQKQAARLRPVQ